MGAILNGLALAKLRVFGSGFLIFSDYGRGSLRLAAIMELPVIYIFTHDSIGVGEDGPTHQPVEHLPSLRAIPGLTVIRPCDANEVAEAWRVMMEKKYDPVALILSRQALPTWDRSSSRQLRVFDMVRTFFRTRPMGSQTGHGPELADAANKSRRITWDSGSLRYR